MSVDRYIALYEELSLDRIKRCDDFVSPDIHFKDPFNDIHGIDLFKKLMIKTLEDVKDPRFKVTHKSVCDDVVFLRWEFDGIVNGLGAWSVVGMSEIKLDHDGRILDHVDHWDAGEQFYMKLPLIGGLLRLIRSRLQVS